VPAQKSAHFLGEDSSYQEKQAAQFFSGGKYLRAFLLRHGACKAATTAPSRALRSFPPEKNKSSEKNKTHLSPFFTT
jgi:hypothetical protein